MRREGKGCFRAGKCWRRTASCLMYGMYRRYSQRTKYVSLLVKPTVIAYGRWLFATRERVFVKCRYDDDWASKLRRKAFVWTVEIATLRERVGSVRGGVAKSDVLPSLLLASIPIIHLPTLPLYGTASSYWSSHALRDTDSGRPLSGYPIFPHPTVLTIASTSHHPVLEPAVFVVINNF